MEIFSAMEIAPRVSRVNSRSKIESGRGPLVITVRAADEPGQTRDGEVDAFSNARARVNRRRLRVIDDRYAIGGQ